MYAAYNIILFIGSLFLLPYYLLKMILTGKYRKSFGPKFGLIEPGILKTMEGSPRIWVHAVSVGEVTAAAPIVSCLREKFPSACIILSTSTETGQAMAKSMVKDATSYIYYPLDIPFVVRRVLGLVRPNIFVNVETELWPNFLRISKTAGIKIVMVNGRISPRSFKNYIKFRFFWKEVLKQVDDIGVISETDAMRIRALGAPDSEVHVFGNSKYDSLAAMVDPKLQEEISEKLNIAPGSMVLVAGSTHDTEEEIIFSVYRRLLEEYPDFKLIIIPRHIERSNEVRLLASKNGFTDYIMMTEIKDGRKRSGERVIIIDIIGELFKIYSLATVVFCGGSLVSKGGQNILEPAAWGKVVFYGPSMDDFMNEKNLLEEAGAGITIRNDNELLEKIRALLKDPETLFSKGEKGRKSVVSNMGASKRYAEMIAKNID